MRSGVQTRRWATAVVLVLVGLLTSGMAAPARAGVAGQPDSEPGEVEAVTTLLVTGEMLIHPRVSRKAAEFGRSTALAYDFSPMFDAVRPMIGAADLALCHLEVQLGVPGVPVAGFPRLAAPAEFATALAGAGFDGCSTASNHANDQGDVGVHSTITALDAAGVAHTGTATNASGATGILYELDELTIGHVSYTYGIQAHRRAHPWSINKIDEDQILADTAALRARGSDFTVVSLHWGAEYRHRPTGSQRRLAEELMASDSVDLIVGHHAHVLQPMERINDKPVLFGLGNFLSNQAPDCCGVESGDGAAVLLVLESVGGRWRVGPIEVVPTWVHRRAGGYLIRPTAAYREGERAWKHLRSSLHRTREHLTLDGEVVQGLTMNEGLNWLLGRRDRSDPASPPR